MSGMRINQRQMQQAMRQMGIKNEAINNVTEVIIRTTDKEIVISPAVVNVMTMKGQQTYLAREAMRVMRMMPKGKPGKENDQPCRTMICIPIVFSL